MKTVEIYSSQNNLIKFIVKLQNSKFRKLNKLILLDGDKTIEGLIDDGVLFEYIFLKKDNPFLNKIQAKEIVFTDEKILKKISTVKTPNAMVAVIKENNISEDIFYDFNKIVLIDGIKDAGNLGTIIRSAAAFSMDGIILINDCVDIFNTKTIRSAAQNMFKIPVIHADMKLVKKLKKTHKLISTVVNSDIDFMNYDFKDKFVIAFGSEANGLSEEVINLSDDKLTLFMDNNVESLNLAVCSSVAFALIKLNQRFIPS